jgi:cardiolipin synthase
MGGPDRLGRLLGSEEALLNIPNLLSLFRLLAAPVIVWALFAGQRDLFFILVCTNLVTDLLDGLIARAFRLQTEFGARLDSLGDLLTFLGAIAGFWVFERSFVSERTLAFSALFACFLIPQVAAFLKFGRQPSFHLYSSKAAAYLQGIFVLTYYLWGYHAGYFHFMIAFVCLSEIEVLAMVLVSDRLVSNARSIFLLRRDLARRRKQDHPDLPGA